MGIPKELQLLVLFINSCWHILQKCLRYTGMYFLFLPCEKKWYQIYSCNRHTPVVTAPFILKRSRGITLIKNYSCNSYIHTLPVFGILALSACDVVKQFSAHVALAHKMVRLSESFRVSFLLVWSSVDLLSGRLAAVLLHSSWKLSTMKKLMENGRQVRHSAWTKNVCQWCGKEGALGKTKATMRALCGKAYKCSEMEITLMEYVYEMRKVNTQYWQRCFEPKCLW